MAGKHYTCRGKQTGKAVNYARNHRETLCNYLLDGRCEISNNATERQAKSYAIGRKAFLFHTSEAGASAVMYSIIETAKSNNLNVFQHLYMALLYMPDYKNEPTVIEALLPWSDFINEHCSELIDVENITPENTIPCRFNRVGTGMSKGNVYNTASYSSLTIYINCPPHSNIAQPW